MSRRESEGERQREIPTETRIELRGEPDIHRPTNLKAETKAEAEMKAKANKGREENQP